jgi:hypothetical protein
MALHFSPGEPMPRSEPQHRAVVEVQMLASELLDARALVAFTLERYAAMFAIAMASDDDRTRAQAAALNGYAVHPVWRVPVATLIRPGPPPQARLPSPTDPI